METKELGVTTSVPKHAVILLVDIQEKYFQEGEQTKKKENRVTKRLKRMKERLWDLKGNGHTIYAITDEEGIH
ncbi:hypothetical protein [Virgibacillus halodenitrificans]|uniref:hypothetical protein n=1 Tax=Virgibacillus halodenitrificans TaxID=1482 RepID=UPI000EF4A995|nr:hypothetical protein [Virgibacillus halodenitrificans]